MSILKLFKIVLCAIKELNNLSLDNIVLALCGIFFKENIFIDINDQELSHHHYIRKTCYVTQEN
jgi:hypothetical protein